MRGDKRSSWSPKGTLTTLSEPQDLTEVERVFPAHIGRLLPLADIIPDEFWHDNGTEWNRIVSQWFFRGIHERVKWIPKDGINTDKALGHLGAIMNSWNPKHEYKEAAVAYLMSLWFKKVTHWEIKA